TATAKGPRRAPRPPPSWTRISMRRAASLLMGSAPQAGLVPPLRPESSTVSLAGVATWTPVLPILPGAASSSHAAPESTGQGRLLPSIESLARFDVLFTHPLSSGGADLIKPCSSASRSERKRRLRRSHDGACVRLILGFVLAFSGSDAQTNGLPHRIDPNAWRGCQALHTRNFFAEGYAHVFHPEQPIQF